MVYAGTTAGRLVDLGVSGRLSQRNLVMWDPQTNSLWSQLRGEAIFGELKGAVLDLVPAVFVPFDTWRLLHPDTLILDLSPVERQQWYFKGADLARGDIEGDALGLGLRSGSRRVLVPLADLHRSGTIEVTVGEQRVLLVWVERLRAPFAYVLPRALQQADRRLEGRSLVLTTGESSATFDAASGDSLTTGTDSLARFPYIPTYAAAWERMHQ